MTLHEKFLMAMQQFAIATLCNNAALASMHSMICMYTDYMQTLPLPAYYVEAYHVI